MKRLPYILVTVEYLIVILMIIVYAENKMIMPCITMLSMFYIIIIGLMLFLHNYPVNESLDGKFVYDNEHKHHN